MRFSPIIYTALLLNLIAGCERFSASSTSSLSLSVTDTEGLMGSEITFTVELSEETSEDVRFKYQTQDGELSAPDNYTHIAGTGVITAGNTSVTISVPTHFDPVDRTSGYFSLKISDPENARIEAAKANATVSNASLILDFMDASLPAGLVFSRTSSATYFNESGVLVSAPSGTPRFDYDPATKKLQGLLLERSATNSLLYSTAFDNVWWTTWGAAVAPSSGIAPDSTPSMTKLVESAVDEYHMMSSPNLTLPDNSVQTFSIYVKSDGRTKFSLQAATKGNDLIDTSFDLEQAQVTYSTAMSHAIVHLGGGLFRCHMSFNVGTGGTSPSLRVVLMDDSGDDEYEGDGTSGILIWGAQLEADSIPSSYIATNGTPATREADHLHLLTGTWLDSLKWTSSLDYSRTVELL